MTPKDLRNSRYPAEKEEMERESETESDTDTDSSREDDDDESELRGNRAIATERGHQILFDVLMECDKRMKMRHNDILKSIALLLNVSNHFALSPFSFLHRTRNKTDGWEGR